MEDKYYIITEKRIFEFTEKPIAETCLDDLYNNHMTAYFPLHPSYPRIIKGKLLSVQILERSKIKEY